MGLGRGKAGMTNSWTSETLYDVLQVSPLASFENLKSSYRQLILKNHPDKAGSDYDKNLIHKIQLAWETLRDEETRLMYDQRLSEQALQMKSFAYDEVPLSEFEVHVLQNGQREYRLQCRCSGEFIIEQEDIDCGFNLVGCTTCSARTLVSME